MPSFYSPGNLGDKMIIGKGIKWILLCSGEIKKNNTVERVEKYERTTCAYFAETHMKNLQQSQLHVVRYQSV